MSDLSYRNNQSQDVPTREQIARRAYEIYEQRGGEPGRELEDWFAAEQELRNQNSSPARFSPVSAEKPPAGSRSRQPKARAASAFEASRSADAHGSAEDF